MFYSSVGDYDPGPVNCDWLSIKREAPTNTKPLERKYRIADAPAIERNVRAPIVVDRGNSYLPRCFISKARMLHQDDGCCEDCAVKAASAMRGQWLVVL